MCHSPMAKLDAGEVVKGPQVLVVEEKRHGCEVAGWCEPSHYVVETPSVECDHV